MSYKAFESLKSNFEIEFIKSQTPQELNEHFNFLKERIDLLESVLFEASEQIYDNPELEEKIRKTLD